MVLKINPSSFPTWRSNSELQIGAGSRAVRLQNLTPSQQKLIDLLYRGVADDALANSASRTGLRADDAQELIKRLNPALIKGPSGFKTNLSPEFVESAFAEIIRASFNTGHDGLSVLNARSVRSVYLTSGDSTSLLLALALASAGLGAIHCNDDSKVERTDLGSLGYEALELGQPRAAAMSRRLEMGSHFCRVTAPSKRFTMQAAVLVGSQITKPQNYADLMRGSTAHLAIEFATNTTTVSPVVIPGKTPCLSCRFKPQTLQDADWPVITAQLQMREDRLDDARSKLFACGAALGLLLEFTDDPRSAKFQGLQLNHETGEIVATSWERDPACECSR